MNCLITGSGGYLGGRLTAYLIEQFPAEVTVYSASRVKQGLPVGSRYRKLDMSNLSTMQGICEGIDVVVHCAAMNEVQCASNPELASIINVEGVSRLLEDALDSGVSKMVYLSTVHVYGTPLLGKLTESALSKPANTYASTHKAAEDLVLSATLDGKLEGYCLRLSNVVGAPTKTDVPRWTLVANDFCMQAVKQQRITLKSDGRQYRDFLCMSDMLSAISHVALGQGIKSGIYNVGSGITIRIIDLANLVAKRAGLMLGKKVVVEYPASDSKIFVKDEVFELSLDKSLTAGLKPRGDLAQEIDETLRVLM